MFYPYFLQPLFIELLKKLPKLQRIEIDKSILRQARKHESGQRKLTWEEFIPRLARICPYLESVHNITGGVDEHICDVSKGTDVSINLRWVGEGLRKSVRDVFQWCKRVYNILRDVSIWWVGESQRKLARTMIIG